MSDWVADQDIERALAHWRVANGNDYQRRVHAVTIAALEELQERRRECGDCIATIEPMCAECGHSYGQHTKGPAQSQFCRHCPCTAFKPSGNSL